METFIPKQSLVQVRHHTEVLAGCPRQSRKIVEIL